MVRSTSDNRCLEPTTPSAPAKEASLHFLDGRSHPSFPRRGDSLFLSVVFNAPVSSKRCGTCSPFLRRGINRSLFRAAKTYRGHARVRVTEVAIIDQLLHTVAALVRVTSASNTFVMTGLRPAWIAFRHEGIVIVVIPITGPL